MANIDFANIAQTPDNALPITGNELIFGAPSRNSPPIVYHLPFTTSGTTNPIVTFYGLIAKRNSFAVTDGNITNISVVNDNVGIGTNTPDGVLTVSKNGQYTNNLISVSNNSNSSTQPAIINIAYGSGAYAVNGSLSVNNTASIITGTGIANSTNLNSDGSNGLSISASNVAGYLSFYTAGKLPANEAVRIFPTGNMAIGFPGSYTDTGKKLNVNGSINVVNNALINGTLAVGGTGAFTGLVTALTPVLNATGNQVVTASWVLSQGFASGSLSQTTANGLYVKQGGGVNQLPNNVYIGWSSIARIKATVDFTDIGNFAMETTTNTFNQPQIFSGGVTGTTAFFSTVTANLQGTASTLGRYGNISAPMTFNWSYVAGQPSYLWGGNDGTNMYVYSPSNFSVNYANTAGNGGVTSVNGQTGAVSITGVNYATTAGNGGVTSVNGLTGAVSITGVNYATTSGNGGVTSVNGQTGAVSITGVNYATTSGNGGVTSVNGQTGAVNVTNVNYATTSGNGGVTSVNGQTGAVNVTNVNYATTSGNGGVTSVNGATGAVTVASTGVGIGQSWQNVTYTLVWGTQYMNTSGKPIQVLVCSEADQNNSWYMNIINPSGGLVGQIYGAITSNTAVRTGGSVSAVIPNGWSYSLSGEKNNITWLILQ